MNRLMTFIGGLLLTATTTSPVEAARLLTATVELDGQIVLNTAYPDDSNPYQERVWRYLADPPGWTESSKIQASHDDPLRAELKGEIVIRIVHVSRTIVEARATELTLVRPDPLSDYWHLPDSEVERVATANGIGEASIFHLSEGERVQAILAVAGGVVIVALVLVILWWFRSPKRTLPEEAS